VNDPEISDILSGALDEAGIGLTMEFGFTDAETAEWKKIIFDLLLNPYTADPLSRLGADSKRKLSGNDRLMMPAKLCLKAGSVPANLAKIIRAGYNFENDDPGTQYVRSLVVGTGLSDAICQTGSIDKDSELHQLIFQEECKNAD
jgi:mannitol-1-phosphate 5-dehydrogenase